MSNASIVNNGGIIFAGSDIGFGTGKTDILLEDKALKFYIQATIATGGDRRLAKMQEKFDPQKSDLTNQLLCMDVEIQDHQTSVTRHVFMGKVAITDGTDSRYCWGDNKSSDEDSMALLITQLAAGQTERAGGKDSDAVFYVGTGLPIKHYFELKEAYENNIKGDYTVTFKSGPWQGVKSNLKIIRCKVYPQVYGIFYDETHDESGASINLAYQQGYTLVLDPGFRTTDYAVFIDGMMKDAYSGSSELGIAFALKQISEKLLEKGIHLDEKELDFNFMENDGIYKYKGNEIDLKPLLDAALKNLAKKLYDDLKLKLQPVWDKLHITLIGGGGGIGLYKHLSFKNMKLVSNPQFGNASGFRKAAQAIVRKSLQENGR